MNEQKAPKDKKKKNPHRQRRNFRRDNNGENKLNQTGKHNRHEQTAESLRSSNQALERSIQKQIAKISEITLEE